VSARRPVVFHLTTTDISLALLLGPQLSAFSDAGYHVVGVSAAGPFVAQLRQRGIEHIALQHATRSVALGRDLRALVELRALLTRLQPDIVHTHNPKPGIYGRIAARAARVPAIVNTQHGLYAMATDRWQKRAAVYGLERLAAACSHAELVQNADDLEQLARLGIPRRRLHLLGNGVDLDRFDASRVPASRVAEIRKELGAGPTTVVCGVVGRMVWEKGFREISAAAALLRSQEPRARFVVIGPADPEKADGVPARELAEAEASGVCLLGHRDDVVELYAAMDVFVLASHREGMSRSGMEAAAMGLPIVATDVRGCREIVDDAQSGLLVPVRDPQALAAAVATLVGNDAGRGAMGRAATRKARREFDQKRVIETTLKVYDRLLAKNPAGL